jgi:tetratricopeptide (TPR) repeat protein
MNARRLGQVRYSLLLCSLSASPLLVIGCGRSPEAVPAAVVAEEKSAAEIAQGHVAEAEKLLAANQRDEAIDELTTALVVARHGARQTQNAALDADILYRRGLAYLELGFPDTAAADFSEVLRLQPDNGPAYAARGNAYVLLGDQYKAVRDCTDAIRYDSECVYAYQWRAEAYSARQQFDRAVADLERATTLDAPGAAELRPLLAKAYLNWSKQLERADEDVEASAKLAKAQELDATMVAEVEPRAAVEEADDAVKQTVAKQVIDEAQEHFAAGMEMLDQRQFNDAIAEFTSAINVRENFADAYLRRGQALMSLGFADTAVRDLQEAARYGSDSIESLRLQAEAFIQLNSPYRAALAATDALHVDPTDAPSYVLRGKAYMALSHWDRAVADLQQAQRLDPKLADEVRPDLERAIELQNAVKVGDSAPATPVVG